MNGAPRLTLSLVALALAASGCEEKPTAPPLESAQKADAGAPLPPGVDRNLAEAVAAVAASAAQAGGPPESGVFGPGEADRELAPDAPPRLVLGGSGAEPRVTFAPAGPRLGKKPTGTVELAIQTGPRSALPTIELSFALEPEGKTEADFSGPSEVVARAVAARLAKNQPGALPPGLDAEVAKLKGGRLRWIVAPSGAGRLMAAELPASVEPSLGQVLGSAGDALSLVFTPYPTEPVGVGAYWMVTSRDRYAGLDVVAYRMVKVEASDASGVTLSVNTRRFAAGGSFALPGIPPHRVEQFQGNTTARLLVRPSEPGSLRGEAQDVIGVGMVTTEAVPRPGAPPAPAGEKIGLELRIRASLAFKP